MRDTTQANSIMTLVGEQYLIIKRSPSDRHPVALTNTHTSCICAVNASCTAQSCIYDFPNITVLFAVPGMYRGCFTTEALLHSSLQCFYDQRCIDQFLSYVKRAFELNITALDASQPSRFTVNSTVQHLVDQLMVEEWNFSVGHDRYYKQCQPSQCTYTSVVRNDAVYIITVLFGLIGGLVATLKIVVPLFVRSVTQLVRFIRKRKTVSEPTAGKGRIVEQTCKQKAHEYRQKLEGCSCHLRLSHALFASF